jgi:hypothetical protein
VGIFWVSIRIRKEGKELNDSVTHVSSAFGLSLLGLGLGLGLFASSSALSVGVFMSLGGSSPDDQATITDAFWEGACKQRVFCIIYGLNPEIWWGLEVWLLLLSGRERLAGESLKYCRELGR